MPDWSQTSAGRSGQDIVDVCRHLLAAPEDVHDVHGLPDLEQRRAHRLAPEHLSRVHRVGGEDAIAALPEVVGNVVGGLRRIGMGTQHGDATGTGEESTQVVVGSHRTFMAY